MVDKEKKSAMKKIKKPRSGFTMVYNAFLDSDKLTEYDKMVFIAIKSFANNQTKQAFPSLATISRISGVSISQVRRCIAKMQDLKILKVEKRQYEYNSGKLSNLYTVCDSPNMWEEDFTTEEEDFMAAAQELPDHVLAEEYKRRFAGKEKELPSTSDQTKDESTSNDLTVIKTTNNYIVKNDESQQQERYSFAQIRVLYDYEVLIHDNPDLEKDIDVVMNILYDALNTTKDTIRVAGENKPAMVVISRLMKLTYEEIKYCIINFNKQTDRIDHQNAYMLTLLYKAPEQFHLDIANRVQHDMYGNKE